MPIVISELTNIAVKVGDEMTMSCEFSSKSMFISWDHIPVQNKGFSMSPKRISTGPHITKGSTEFSLGGNPMGQLLILKFTELKHSGSYRCAAEGKASTAQLIVLGKWRLVFAYKLI